MVLSAGEAPEVRSVKLDLQRAHDAEFQFSSDSQRVLVGRQAVVELASGASGRASYFEAVHFPSHNLKRFVTQWSEIKNEIQRTEQRMVDAETGRVLWTKKAGLTRWFSVQMTNCWPCVV